MTATPPPPAVPDPPPPRGLDLVLVATVFSLVGLGLVMVYSSSAIFAATRYQDPAFFLRRDLAYAGLGLVALYAGYRVDYRLYRRFAYPILGGALLLLALLLVPGAGTRVDGAVRWFRLGGLSFQPSEPAKLALIVYLAHSLAKKREIVGSFSVGILPHLLVAGLVGLLVVRQPDLGNTAIILAVTLIMLFAAGARVGYLLLALLAAAPVGYQLIVGTPWRLRRLLAFLDPWAYQQGAGYQVSESLISVGAGGFTGLGLGAGKQKLLYLPAAHTDFILAIIGEELGLVGMGIVAALFLVILARGLRAARGAPDLFGAHLAFGITCAVLLQALLHVAVVLGLVPTKGITLPMVSYGGSALVTNLYMMGVLLNVAARWPAPERVRAALRRGRRKNRKRPPRVVVASDP